MLQRDGARISDAFDRMSGLDFADAKLDLELPDFQRIQESCDKLFPQMRTAIEKLEWSSRHDNLTSLLQANSFRAECEKWLHKSANAGAMLYFDVNDFKKINDTLGHNAGDHVLTALADRLRLAATSYTDAAAIALATKSSLQAYRPIISRIGGDEFAMFLPDATQTGQVERFVQRLQRVIGEPCVVGLQTMRIRVSIGIAFAHDCDCSFERLLAAADGAMYAAKADGGGTYRFYSESMRSNADRVLERECELRNALIAHQFCLHFQPQYSLRRKRIESVEALIRWNHPQRGLVMPGDFIDFAETHGLIDEIGDWVIAEGARALARWQQAGIEVTLSINVSPKQLQRVELIALVRANLERYGVAPNRLELEITEAAIMRDEGHSFERLEGLRKDGVMIALDDFGTGYSNLSQLMMIPMDRLKLDKSLIDRIDVDQRKWVIASGMIRLARDLGFSVVAEGVESQAQLELLDEAGCDTVQGYAISRPIPEEKLLDLLRSYEVTEVRRAG
jgi:diguanylate cyclase (GGDEF)-like protein